MMWVLDASVAVRWFLEDESDPHADEVLARVVEEPGRFAVPELFAFEVFSVLLRLHPAGADVYRRGVLPLLQGGLLRHPMTDGLAGKAAEFALLGLTGYDACYAGLARELEGRWLTFDEKAHRLIRAEGVSWLVSRGLPDGWQ